MFDNRKTDPLLRNQSLLDDSLQNTKNPADAHTLGRDINIKGKTLIEFTDERLFKKRIFDNYLGTIMQSNRLSSASC